IALGCLLGSAKRQRATIDPSLRTRRAALDVATPVVIIVMSWLLLILRTRSHDSPRSVVLAISLPALLCFAARKRPPRFALAVGAVFFALTAAGTLRSDVLLSHRSFFGIQRVVRTEEGPFNEFYHGSTL